MSINKNLQLLIDWINEFDFKTIADIGTDHGNLLIEISKKDKNRSLFGIDVVKSIIDNLNKNKKYKNIKWIHGFGLNPLQGKHIELIVISGLGVLKILKILKLDNNLQDNIIIQTNQNINKIREWVNKKKYLIKKENINFEKGYFYHSIFISKKEYKNKNLNEEEIYFGPILIKEKTKNFINYWTKKLFFLKKNIINIKDDFRKKQFLNEIEKIEKILN